MMFLSELFVIFHLPILADIASPPSPLHRIGFEVLPKECVLFEKCLWMTGEVLFVLGFILTIALFFVVKFGVVRRQRTNRIAIASSMLLLLFGALLVVRFATPAKSWKPPSQVMPWEEREFAEKIESGKEDLQRRFDSEYTTINATNGLERIGLFSGHFPEYMHDRARDRIRTQNAETVVKCILERDAALRMHYDGVPIEWIARAMNCPDPSIDDTSIKNAFRTWAMSQMPSGLNGVERQIVFEWQFAFYEHERRPWRRIFSEVRGVWNTDSGVRDLVEPDDTDDLSKRPDLSRKLEEFREVSDSMSAREYVVKWANRAKAVKYAFQSFDSRLINKAGDINRDFGKSGIVGFMFDRDIFTSGWYDGETRIFPSTKLTFRGDITIEDIDLVAEYCRQLRINNKWYCELEELRFVACTPETVKCVFDKLSGCRIHRHVIVTGGQHVSAEMAGIRNLEVEAIIFSRAKIDQCSVPFKAPRIKEMSFMDCGIVDLDFVSEFENIEQLGLHECRVVNGMAIAKLKKLRSLNIYGCPWNGMDWLPVVKACPDGVRVVYDEKDVPVDMIDELKRIVETKRQGCR